VTKALLKSKKMTVSDGFVCDGVEQGVNCRTWRVVRTECKSGRRKIELKEGVRELD